MRTITVNVSQSSLPVNFFTASEYYVQPDMKRTSDEMSFYQILFILEGRGRLFCQGKEYPLSRGCAFYIAKGVPYRHTDDGGLISAFLSFKGEGMKFVSERYTADGFMFVDSINADAWASRIGNFISDYSRGDTDGQLSVKAYNFCIDFFEEKNKKSVSPLDKILKFAETHFKENLTLDDLAQVGSMSVSSLCHSFKKQYGKTVFEHIISLRLEWARGYIIANPSSLTKDVAKLSGFEDTSYFCRVFKKKYGHSPSRSRISIN